MQITCPKCKKKFEVNEDLIPKKGRDVQCGSCENKWFFTKTLPTQPKKVLPEKEIPKLKKAHFKVQTKVVDERSRINENSIVNKNNKFKQKSVVKENTTNYFKLLIVLIISIISFIVLLDTFKNQISVYFPNIILVLENLYESLRDINLFLKDLIN